MSGLGGGGMSRIELQRDETLESVEHHLQDLQGCAGDVPMWLPSDFPERVAVDVSLLQLLMTWSQKQTVPSLRTWFLSGDAEAASEKFCENVVGLSAVALSTRVSSRDHLDIRTQLRTKARQQVDWMIDEKARFQRGTSFAVLCFDGSSKPRPRNLYYANGEVLSARDLKALFARRLGKLESNSARRVRIEEVATSLGTILFETFRNTDQWARTTVEGVPIRRGVRGVLVRRYRQHPAQQGSGLEQRHEQDAPLSRFLARHLGPTDSGGMLELSVFDGGPGLVRRSQGITELSSISPADERAACLECFNKHNTSSDTPHRGLGLYAAMRELSQLRGFLRLRTGRLALFRDLHDEPFEEGAPASFSDWPGRERGANAEVAGTVLTFLLPIPEVSR